MQLGRVFLWLEFIKTDLDFLTKRIHQPSRTLHSVWSFTVAI